MLARIKGRRVGGITLCADSSEKDFPITMNY